MAAIQGRQRIGDKQLGVLFDGGKCYIVYHGRDLSDAQNPVDTRCARIDEMHVDQGRLSVTPTP